jgi:ankyrin repeat protein
MIKALVEGKESINVRFSSGITPLSYAAYFDRYDIAKYLLGHGASLEETTTLSNKNLTLIETPILSAAYGNHVDIVELFLKNGADVNSTDNYGKTALMYAADYGNMKMVKLLVKDGAYIQAESMYGKKTAVDFARQSRHFEIADYLLNYLKTHER